MSKRLGLVIAVLSAVACAFAQDNAEAVLSAYPSFGLTRVETMMFLVLQIGVIIFAAKLGGAIAGMLKLPSILGELAAGIAIGPWALGGIGFGEGVFASGLFHGAELRRFAAQGMSFDATSPELYAIATLASIILLFLSGLETNLRMFLKYSFVGSLVGVGGVVFSFLFGDLCAVLLLPVFFDSFKYLRDLPFAEAVTSAAPLYMGIMSTATSVGITARILSEKKKLDSPEGTTIMAGAVIDDVLGLIVLAVGNGIIAAATMQSAGAGGENGMDWGEIGVVAVKAFGVWIAATAIGILAARWISGFLKVCFKSPVVISTMAFGLALVLAGFFELMGLAMIIGAYVMGLALSRTDLKHTIQEMLTPVYTFLVPVFFCVMGMMVDVSALCSKTVLCFGAVYTVLAIAAKIIGCMVPSLFCGFNMRGSLRIGAGMVPRGEVALIIAGIGLSSGYLTQEIFGIGVMMTLVTTLVAPPLLVGLFASPRRGTKRLQDTPSGDSRPITLELATPEAASLMLDCIVDAFRKEGFFTCMLNAKDQIWQFSKDASEIAASVKGKKLRFECTRAEENFLVTAIIEVASELGGMAHDLQRPIKTGMLAELIEDSDKTAGGQKASFSMLRYIRRFVMIPDLKASSCEDAVTILVDKMAQAGVVAQKKKREIVEAVLRREKAMGTGLDHQLAVPHGRTDAVDGLVGAVAIVKDPNGIPNYETNDNSPVRIIVLTVANNSESTPYLQLLSHLSAKLRDEEGRRQLLESSSSAEMLKCFL